MSDTTITPRTTPESLHAGLQAAFRAGDLDAYTALYAADATLVVPPEGTVVHGRDAIRAATAPLISLHPRMTSTVIGKVEGNGVAVTHARWEFEGADPEGALVQMQGKGTLVSRQADDGTWEILIDDPMSPDAGT